MKKRKPPTPNPNAHDSSTTGRIAELYFAALMLNEGYELYQPVVDCGVDYLAKSANGHEVRFQCKIRTSPNATVWDLSLPKSKRAKTPTHLFYMRGKVTDGDFWIVPFPLVEKISKKLKTKTNRKLLRIYITKANLYRLRDYRGEYGLEELRKWCLEKVG